MTGNEYKKAIGRYIATAYAERGLQVYDEVALGTTIIGKQRRIDLFVLGPNKDALGVECKFQDSSGTADEKIPYALRDMSTARVPGVIVYAGSGFSTGVLHLLQGSELAAYCLPGETQHAPNPKRSGPLDSGTWQLDHVLAQRFKFWDLVLRAKPAIPAALLNTQQDAATSDEPQKRPPKGV